jgi:hypothetical protein
LVTGLFSFQKQWLDMIRQFVILVPVITANMFGNQIYSIINKDSFGKAFDRKFGRSVMTGNRVSVPIDFDAELAVGAEGVDNGRLISRGMQRL